MVAGLKTAALYGIYPHQLGFCGSREESSPSQIYDFLSGKKVSLRKIRKILEGLKGAFFYYKLIARANGFKDPFDEKVIKAYWIGSNLLERVETNDLREMIRKDFVGPGLLSKKMAGKKAKEIPEGAKPHHSFHVLVIGSVTGRVRLKGKMLDLCRVGWGKVIKEPIIKNKESRVWIKYQPLMGSKILKLEKPIKKEIFWDKNLVPKIKIGDWVSFHWNHLIQRLNKKEVKYLKRYTNFTLKLLRNSLK